MRQKFCLQKNEANRQAFGVNTVICHVGCFILSTMCCLVTHFGMSDQTL